MSIYIMLAVIGLWLWLLERSWKGAHRVIARAIDQHADSLDALETKLGLRAAPAEHQVDKPVPERTAQ